MLSKIIFSIESNSVRVHCRNWLFLQKQENILVMRASFWSFQTSSSLPVPSLLLKVYFFPCSQHQGLRVSAIRVGREIEPSGLERSSERIRFIALPFVNHATHSCRREEKFEVSSGRLTSRFLPIILLLLMIRFRCELLWYRIVSLQRSLKFYRHPLVMPISFNDSANRGRLTGVTDNRRGKPPRN